MSLRLDAQATAVDTSSGAVLGSWRVVRSTKKMYRLEDWAEQEGLAQSKYKELMRKVASDLVFSAYLAPEQRVFPKTRRTRSYSYHSQRGLPLGCSGKTFRGWLLEKDQLVGKNGVHILPPNRGERWVRRIYSG